MTPDQRENLEQIARAWVDVNGLGHHPYSNEMVGSLANLLAAQRAAALEEAAAMHAEMFRTDHPCNFHEMYIDWLRQQAQEKQP